MTSVLDYLDKPVRITRAGRVYIGDDEMPGVIAENGIVITPGNATDINRMTVTFLVGAVNVDGDR